VTSPPRIPGPEGPLPFYAVRVGQGVKHSEDPLAGFLKYYPPNVPGPLASKEVCDPGVCMFADSDPLWSGHHDRQLWGGDQTPQNPGTQGPYLSSGKRPG
jgi:hypothetical protein